MNDDLSTLFYDKPKVAKRRRGGRRPLPPGERKAAKINVRVTSAQHSELERQALAAKLPIGTYLYRLALGRRPVVIPEINHETYYQLAKLGANLNQAQRAVNEARLAAEGEREWSWTEGADALIELSFTVAALRDAVDEARRLLIAGPGPEEDFDFDAHAPKY